MPRTSNLASINLPCSFSYGLWPPSALQNPVVRPDHTPGKLQILLTLSASSSTKEPTCRDNERVYSVLSLLSMPKNGPLESRSSPSLKQTAVSLLESTSSTHNHLIRKTMLRRPGWESIFSAPGVMSPGVSTRPSAPRAGALALPASCGAAAPRGSSRCRPRRRRSRRRRSSTPRPRAGR